jgi:hypothetical protein
LADIDGWGATYLCRWSGYGPWSFPGMDWLGPDRTCYLREERYSLATYTSGLHITQSRRCFSTSAFQSTFLILNLKNTVWKAIDLSQLKNTSPPWFYNADINRRLALVGPRTSHSLLVGVSETDGSAKPTHSKKHWITPHFVRKSMPSA